MALDTKSGRRVLLISGLALLVTLGAVFWAPEGLAQYSELAWALTLIPAFLFAHARRWSGALWIFGIGIALVVAAELVWEAAFFAPIAWQTLLGLTAALLVIGVASGWFEERMLARGRAQALDAAYLDPMTGLATPELLDVALAREFAAAQRGRRFAIALFEVAPEVPLEKSGAAQVVHELKLRSLAEILARNTRKMDLSARSGPHSLVTVLSGAREEAAEVFVERIRGELNLAAIDDATIGIGVAGYQPTMKSFVDLLEAAERSVARPRPSRSARPSAFESSA